MVDRAVREAAEALVEHLTWPGPEVRAGRRLITDGHDPAEETEVPAAGPGVRR